VPLHPAWFHSLTSATFITEAGLLDVVLRPDGLRGYGPLRASSQPIEVYGMRVQVAALADIIRSKEAADRDKDRAALGTLRPGAGAPRRLRRPTDRAPDPWSADARPRRILMTSVVAVAQRPPMDADPWACRRGVSSH
jgi:hypothetical protein